MNADLRSHAPGRRKAAPIRRRAAVAIVVAGTALAAACERTPPTVLDHSASRSFAGLTQLVHVNLDRPTAFAVRYWADGAPTLELVSEEAQSHEVTLTHLKGARSYQYEIRLPDGADPTVSPLAAGSFGVPPVPPHLTELDIRAEGTPTTPLTMLALRALGRNSFVIVDGAGDIVWYMQSAGGPAASTRLGDGNFVLQSSDGGLTVVTPDGAPVVALSQLGMPESTGPGSGTRIHHDVVPISDESVLYLARAVREFEDTTWVGEQIWEWTPATGADVLRWDSWDFMSPATDLGPRSNPGDWLHANALGIGPDGNILVSLHYLDQVLSIAPDYSEIEWRLGGPGSTFQIPDDAVFSGQHTVAQLTPSRILMFDNGFSRANGERFSRALELELDFQAGTATKVWEFRPQPDNYARVVSSARRLPNGNTLVGFGTGEGESEISTGPVEVYEVTPAGDVVWHLIVGGATQMYRATPFDAITSPGPVIVR